MKPIICARSLSPTDAALGAAAADPLIWAGHPATDRWRPEVFGPYFDTILAGGGGLLIAARKGGRVLGMSRFYIDEEAPDDIAIGFTFLIRQCWGGPANFAVKSLMLDHAFAQPARVWFHIARDNLRSQTATSKLGAVNMGPSEMALAGARSPRLRFCLERDTWRARRAGVQPAVR